MTKIEEVARAIAMAHHSDDGDWIAWTGEARAAIEAMRTPSDGMRQKMRFEFAACSTDTRPECRDGVHIWEGGIDAALAEIAR